VFDYLETVWRHDGNNWVVFGMESQIWWGIRTSTTERQRWCK